MVINMDYKKNYQSWLNSPYVDELTKRELKNLSESEIQDRFFKDLEFGTGGLRGIMEAGTNRLNIYTIRKATQGVADELLSCGNESEKGVVIAFDSRNNSSAFAAEAAKVFCANGIKTYLFEGLRPTPLLSFAVRHLGCARGIVITASHNPKEYNGYKVYGEDGGQIPPETAEKIIEYINKTDIFKDIKETGSLKPYIIGKEVDDAYIRAVHKQSFGIKIPDDFKVIYTPLHGSGMVFVKAILEKIGVNNLFVIPEQENPDGNFPTVKSPNPENHEAFDIAIKYAKEQNADLILGTDPDSDRIGVVIKTPDGDYTALNGNQTGALLCEYILRKTKESSAFPTKSFVVKTIVTTEMIKEIAQDYGIAVCDTLTGFKYIGEKIKVAELEGNADRFIFGLEESYGYLKGTYARDKDAVVASMLVAEMAADYKAKGITLYQALLKLYEKYGYHKEALETLTLTGIDGMNKINKIMEKFRTETPPVEILFTEDYKQGFNNLPKSDVIKFFIKDGWFAVRPSGTEPKIKFYFGIKTDSLDNAVKKLTELKTKILKFAEI